MRVPRLLPWLQQRRPDVVCLQETKLSDAAFADLLGEQLDGLGYRFAHHGHGQWNGVAILSRVGLDEVTPDFEGQPEYAGVVEARAISATCGGVRVHSLYVPNGRTVGSDHYDYKLAWLDALRAAVATGPAHVALCGDMNVAPADADVFDPPPTSARPTSPVPSAIGSPPSAWSTWCGSDGPASGSSRTGTTGPACSTRTSACASTWC